MTTKQENELGALCNLYVYIENIVNSGKYRSEPLELRYQVYNGKTTLWDINDNIMRKGGGDFLEGIKFDRYGYPDCGKYSFMNRIFLEKYVKKLDGVKDVVIKYVYSKYAELNRVTVEFE